MSSSQPRKEYDFEELHQALVARGSLDEYRGHIEHLIELLSVFAKKIKRDNDWNEQDIENIVAEAITNTIDKAYKGEIVSSFIGAAMYEVKTVIGSYQTAFGATVRKTVGSKRTRTTVSHVNIDADDAVENYHLQRALGAHNYKRPEIELLHKEGLEHLVKALNSCDARTQSVIRKDIIDEVDQSVIASELGIEKGYVSKLKTRGLDKIKKSFYSNDY